MRCAAMIICASVPQRRSRQVVAAARCKHWAFFQYHAQAMSMARHATSQEYRHVLRTRVLRTLWYREAKSPLEMYQPLRTSSTNALNTSKNKIEYPLWRLEPSQIVTAHFVSVE